MNSPRRRRAISAAALAAGAGLALAAPAFGAGEIAVRLTKRSGCAGSPQTYYVNAGAPIALTVSSCDQLINIWAVDGSSAVGAVTISAPGTPPADLSVFIGQGSFPTGGGVTTPACGDFGGLSVGGQSLRNVTRFAGAINGNLTGPVHVGSLYRFDVAGVLSSVVRARQPGGGLFRLNAGTVGVPGLIVCDTGTVQSISIAGDCWGNIEATQGGIALVSVGGSLYGDVRAPLGPITRITCGGDIGSASFSVNIHCNGEIRSIVAGSIHADIDNNISGVPCGTSGCDVYEVRCDSGDFRGSLRTDALLNDHGPTVVSIAGNLRGRIETQARCAGRVVIGGNISPEGLLRIGADFDTAGAAPPIPARTGALDISGKLEGQVIVNAGMWHTRSPAAYPTAMSVYDGPTRVMRQDILALAPIVLDQPYYPTISSSMGGGAVGLAPFNLHHADCQPLSGSTIGASALVTTPIVLRHYGPVLGSGPGRPATVERRVGMSSTWEDVSPLFVISTGIPGEPRLMQVGLSAGSSLSSGEYRVRPVLAGPDRLKCIEVWNEPSVHDWTYYFNIASPCDGVVFPPPPPPPPDPDPKPDPKDDGSGDPGPGDGKGGDDGPGDQEPPDDPSPPDDPTPPDDPSPPDDPTSPNDPSPPDDPGPGTGGTDGLPGDEPPPPNNTAEVDCNNNGIPDACDIYKGISLDVDPADGIPDECQQPPPACTADWNNSGSVDVQDVYDFLTDWAAMNADFNGSGSVTVQDIYDYFAAWQAGCP